MAYFMTESAHLSFIHAADFHLGSPFKGIGRLAPHAASFLAEATYKAFDNLINEAVERNVDFVLCAGDLLDLEDRNLRALLHLRRGFKRLQEHGIRVYVVHGNHDPYEIMSKSVEFPENVFVFPPRQEEWIQTFGRNGMPVSIWGASFKKKAEKRNLVRLVPALSAEGYKIGLLHCTVGSGGGHDPYAPCQVSDLRAGRCDYWALGHIHKKNVVSSQPLAVYSGNIQGRSFKEQGPRGCFVVEVREDAESSCTFFETCVVKWHEESVDVSHISTLAELMDKMYERVNGLRAASEPCGLICRIRLEGICSFHESIYANDSLDQLTEELNACFDNQSPLLLVAGIENHSIPATDMEKRKKAGDLVSYVLREADRLEIDPNKLTGPEGPLAQLFQNRRFAKFGIALDEDDAKQIVLAAQHLLLHLLEHPDK